MYKFVVLPLFFAAVSAGIIGAPLVGHAPLAVAAPAVHAVATPVIAAHAPVATSYANTHRIVHDSVPVARPVAVAHAAPVVAHAAPVVAHAAPVVATYTSHGYAAPALAAYH